MLTILRKIGNTKLTFDLFFMRNNQFTLIQSSIKDINHITLERLGIQEGPQTSIEINKKWHVDFALLEGNKRG